MNTNTDARTLNQVMLEGQEKTLEVMALMQKQVAGTITEGESQRLAMLNGNLLALSQEAIGLGLNPTAIMEATKAAVEAEKEEDYGLDEDGAFSEYDEDEDEDLFGYDEDEDILEIPTYGRGGIY